MAIRGVHAMFYSGQSEAVRDFFRDKVKLPYTDVGDGWLIFDVSEGDIGVHPVETEEDSNTHDISFYCDDIEATVAELKANGVTFDGDIQDQGWGRVTRMAAPGGLKLMLYQPRYEKRTSSKPAAAPAVAAKQAVKAAKKIAKKAAKKVAKKAAKSVAKKEAKKQAKKGRK